MKREAKREGFTLVELLIVIVVIGILSAMMMLSSTEAVSTAKANNIIANLRNLKTAALAWYMDSIDQMEGVNVGSIRWNTNRTNDPNNYWNHVKRYMSTGASKELDENYSLVSSSQINSGQTGENADLTMWFVVYGNDKLGINIRKKLKSRAKSVGLLREALSNSKPYGQLANGRDNPFTSDKGTWVFMRVK